MPLTRKQQRALNNAPKSARASMRANFTRQSGDNGKKNGNGNGRNSRKDYGGIVQSVGQAPTVPFGSTSVGKLDDFTNAIHPAHLALPRPVASYSVVRYSSEFTVAEPFSLWGPIVSATHQGSQQAYSWTSVMGIGAQTADLPNPMNAAGGGRAFQNVGMRTALAFGVQFVPSAYTIQIMNPEALQTTNGICFIARLKTNFVQANSTETWNSVISNLISFQCPRLCAAAKLAMRGVQVDALPLNMADAANFTALSIPSSSGDEYDFTWDGTGDGAVGFRGFTPIMVHNPDGIGLRIMVTAEYRVRFDPSNPACSSHVHHAPAPVSTWDKIISSAEAVGHGVRDIADVVSHMGYAVGTVRSALGPVRAAPLMVE